MPPAHLSSSERRARRARRKKLRRNGKRLIAVGWVVVSIAALVGVIGLRTYIDGNKDENPNDEGVAAVDQAPPATPTTRRARPSAVGTGETVVVDLVPTTAVPGGDSGGGAGGGGSTGTTVADAAGETFGVRTDFGIVQVDAAARNARPNPNAAPRVTMPAEITRNADNIAVVSGITVTDPDWPGSGDIGVALIGPGQITVTLNQDVKLLSRNSTSFVGLAGPPGAINRAIADLRFQSDQPVDLVITVTDWGYGDISRSQSGFASTRIR